MRRRDASRPAVGVDHHDTRKEVGDMPLLLLGSSLLGTAALLPMAAAFSTSFMGPAPEARSVLLLPDRLSRSHRRSGVTVAVEVRKDL